jgi:plasmid stability protein
MSSITVRDLPPELHEALKESAEHHRRSLNAEILFRLEQSVRSGAGRRLSVEEIRRSNEEFHERLRRDGVTPITDEEITRYKRLGRP